MKTKRSGYKDFFINLVFPAVVFGSVTGTITAVIVTVYKFCAKHIIAFSHVGYRYLNEHLYLIPVVLAALFGLAYVFSYCYRKHPNLRGGGIPTSVGILRGEISFHWFVNVIGVFLLSLVSFLIGVPLGTEGPSTQMGTAIGRGCIVPFSKKHQAWDRYAMTGGACAGFSTATGAPVTGVVFAMEEVHHSTSPMIIMVAATSVICADLVSNLLSPVFGVSARLFPMLEIPTLPLKDMWIPVLIGVAVGLFSALFLRYYRLINRFRHTTLANIPPVYKIFAVFAVTVGLGLCSPSFISTGHELVESLSEVARPIWLLLLILLVRSTGTLAATTNGITGGLYLPTLALGAVLAAAIGFTGMSLGISADYFELILALGMASCLAGMMKFPITAIVFAIEALSCGNNILPVIIAVSISFILTEIFNAKSISEHVLENRIEQMHRGKTAKTAEREVTVQPHAFAVGKQVRDIFWPHNLFVLSIQHAQDQELHLDVHGEKVIQAGDVLRIRYSTYDEPVTQNELMAIVGEQD